MPKREPSIVAVTQGSGEELGLGSSLCTRCGLCCMGVLHGAAVLDPDEIASARALGLPVLDREKPGFALPCPRLEGTVCTIYPDRPRVCGRYKCQLLRDVEAGVRSLDEAVDKVGTAKTLLSEAMAVLPEGMSLKNAKAVAVCDMTEMNGPEGALDVRHFMALKLRITGLMLYLDKHFRNSDEGKMLGSSLVDTEVGAAK